MRLVRALTVAALAFGLSGAATAYAAGPPILHSAGTPVADPPEVQAQQQALLSVRADPGAGFRPVVSIGPVLNSARLDEAARSGLPVRVRVRVELWRDRLFDQLVDSTSWTSVIVYEPLGDLFFVRSQPAGGGARRFASFSAARTVVEGTYNLSIRPLNPGRYYYTASLQIETLSLSDLEELERWLQGELQPAVSGQRSVPGAVGQGAKRLMLRLLDLPQRRVDARSDRFDLPARS
jgi:hypothetical protein